MYEFETVLPGSGMEIKFKPITTGQMKSLLAHEQDEAMGAVENVLDILISDCVVEPEDFNVEDLYINDRFFLIIELRKNTRGTKYEFEWACPECRSQSLQVVDLKKLKVSKLPKEFKNIVKLDNNISVRMDFPRRIDQKLAYEIIKEAGDINEAQRTAELGVIVTALTMKSIITPAGEDQKVTIEDKIFLLEGISTTMYEKIANWSTTNFGVDFQTTIKCKSCKHQKTIDIPPENFFF
jgi:hypothetical protein